MDFKMDVYIPTRFLMPIKVLYFAFFAWFCGTGWLHPLANWDMFPYVGVVCNYTGKANEARECSLKDIKSYISDEQYKQITSGSPFLETVANDDRAFKEQLPYRFAKPLYVFLTGVVALIVGNLAMASVLVSSIGFFMIGAALYLLRPQNSYEPYWLISVLGILYLGNPQLTLLTQASTPDTLATGFGLMGFWACLRRPESVYPALLTSLAILARPDFGVMALSLFPYFICLYRDRTLSGKGLAFTLAMPMATLLLCKVFFVIFGAEIQLIDTLKGPFIYPSTIDTTGLIPIYKEALLNDILSLIALPRFDLFLVLGLSLFVFTGNPYTKLIVFAALANLMTKIIFFPNFDAGYQERYFFISYLLVWFAVFNAPAKPAPKQPF